LKSRHLKKRGVRCQKKTRLEKKRMRNLKKNVNWSKNNFKEWSGKPKNPFPDGYGNGKSPSEKTNLSIRREFSKLSSEKPFAFFKLTNYNLQTTKMNKEITTEFSFILKKSKYGIGVFATHPIKKDAPLRLFGDLNLKEDVAIKRKPGSVPKIFEQYCVFRSDFMLCPSDFGCMEVGWFVNHSKKPNIYHKNYDYYALKDIKEGDEITVDYNSLEEPDKNKEEYYK
jgi:SET domain-containing protein